MPRELSGSGMTPQVCKKQEDRRNVYLEAERVRRSVASIVAVPHAPEGDASQHLDLGSNGLATGQPVARRPAPVLTQKRRDKRLKVASTSSPPVLLEAGGQADVLKNARLKLRSGNSLLYSLS